MGSATENYSKDKVTIKSPCSTSNLGLGYDVFGLALDALHDILEIRLGRK